jgi:diacylglycerol kinase family enzyme
MDRSAGRLLRAIERGDVRRVDVGAANGRCFLLMASAGIDAEVVHDLAARRRAGISHLAYAGPIARQLLRWRPRPMTLDCDGARIVDGASGVAIVANSRQYAGRLDPAPRASMSDGVLDVVFLPARSRLDLVRWAWACARRRHLGDRRLLYRLGREVRIRADAVFRYQLDGDPPGPPNAGDDHATAELSISITPGALPVLIP